MNDMGKYLLGAVACASIAAVIIFGDPAAAQGWAVPLGGLAVAIPSIIGLFQNNTQGKKLDEVRREVNGNAQRELNAKGVQSHAEGVTAGMEQLKPLIAEAVRAAVLAEREATQAAAVAATMAAAEAQASVVGPGVEPPVPRDTLPIRRPSAVAGQ